MHQNIDFCATHDNLSGFKRRFYARFNFQCNLSRNAVMEVCDLRSIPTGRQDLDFTIHGISLNMISETSCITIFRKRTTEPERPAHTTPQIAARSRFVCTSGRHIQSPHSTHTMQRLQSVFFSPRHVARNKTRLIVWLLCV